jgi:nitrite reductase (NADH) small subunit
MKHEAGSVMPEVGANLDYWKPICRVDEIPVLGARRLEKAGSPPVAVFKTADNSVFALVDRCPHKGGPLSQGIVMAHGVACPLHNWTIRFEDGCAAAPDEGCTPKLRVHIADGVVHLALALLEALVGFEEGNSCA